MSFRDTYIYTPINKYYYMWTLPKASVDLTLYSCNIPNIHRLLNCTHVCSKGLYNVCNFEKHNKHKRHIPLGSQVFRANENSPIFFWKEQENVVYIKQGDKMKAAILQS